MTHQFVNSFPLSRYGEPPRSLAQDSRSLVRSWVSRVKPLHVDEAVHRVVDVGGILATRTMRRRQRPAYRVATCKRGFVDESREANLKQALLAEGSQERSSRAAQSYRGDEVSSSSKHARRNPSNEDS